MAHWRKQIIFLTFLAIAISNHCFAQMQPSPGGPHGEDEFYINWKRYYNYAEMSEIMKRLVARYPYMAKLASIGKSYQGRDLWVMEIGNPKTGNLAKKPAMWIDGNTHGNEVNGAEVCLHIAWYLLTRYGEDKYVTKLVDTRTFYILPMLNPDGREIFLTTPGAVRGNLHPVDDDGDGLFDEDPPEDLDGDGHILMMRKRDPYGRYKLGADPRLMVRVDDDEPPGGWTLLGTEGIDNDGDGQRNEDGPGGYDLNRNYPSYWRPGNGAYPLSEPETRAVVDFMLAHRNIAGVQSFHNFGQMILRPYGTKSDRSFPRNDLRVYKTIQKRGEEILPGYRGLQIFLQLYPVYGGFLDWTYEAFGVISFTNELWRMPEADYNGDGKTDGAERLKWNDEELFGTKFIAWKPFKHPELGDIEIGGWTKFVRRSPPQRYLEDECLRNTLFVLYHAEQMPLVRISKLEVSPVEISRSIDSAKTETSGNSVKIELTRPKANVRKILAWVAVTIINDGMIPTVTQQAKNAKVYKPDIIKLSLSDNAKLIDTRDIKENVAFGRDGALVLHKDEVEINGIPGHAERKVKWLIRVNGQNTKASAVVSIVSEKGGSDTKSISIQVQ